MTIQPAGGGIGISKPPVFPPKEDRKVSEPDLPPRPPKLNTFLKGPDTNAVSVLLHYIIYYDVIMAEIKVPGGRRNTFPTPAKPPPEKPVPKVSINF